MEGLTKADCNGIRHTDARSRNDQNQSLFWANWEIARLEREFHEAKARRAEARMSLLEAEYMDAQDACWDGVL